MYLDNYIIRISRSRILKEHDEARIKMNLPIQNIMYISTLSDYKKLKHLLVAKRKKQATLLDTK